MIFIDNLMIFQVLAHELDGGLYLRPVISADHHGTEHGRFNDIDRNREPQLGEERCKPLGDLLHCNRFGVGDGLPQKDHPLRAYLAKT